MNKGWRIFEIIISMLQIILGITILTIIIPPLNKMYMIISYDFGWQNISIYKFSNIYIFPIIKGILGIISGVLLLKQKLIGWILSIIFWLILATSALLYSWTITTSDPKFIFSIIILLISMILLAILFKPIKNNYLPTKKSWIFIGIMTLVFLIEKLYQYLFSY